ncbi:hypothetical protein SDRG_02229 [Saprolegnia diclina VS20]|uniref:Uncharacterized protein n=1 Tax=Saprolegnia diclina (strain VS20) TaxID=1156394 RepID=T0S594_SAPDV|nr:hypothetical protein SDRG_02229 [Saprolegnia diclina VS20]EQC40328.1 hypothetical protein SDRG_02229 [Saprolegnia diclina VS20]|eukprot:XP_008606027.1 hypothetical protein SDRG_02229 [Saprolegnia diclina VS20]
MTSALRTVLASHDLWTTIAIFQDGVYEDLGVLRAFLTPDPMRTIERLWYCRQELFSDSLLHELARQGHSAALQWLHVQRPSPPFPTQLVDDVARRGQLAALAFLIGTCGANASPDAINSAVHAGRSDVLTYLLQTCQPSNANAMMFAIAHRHLDCIRLLWSRHPLPPSALLELDIDDDILACLVEASSKASSTY